MEIENRKLFKVKYSSGVEEYVAAKDYKGAVKIIRYTNNIPEDAPGIFESEIEEIKYMGLVLVSVSYISA